jgi:DNA-binding protein H-NS
MASKLPNIDNLSLSDLNELISRAQKAIALKKDEAKSGFLAKMRADAAAAGLDLDEVMGKGPGGRRQRSDKGIKLKPKYVGPNGEIYTGRGPTPKWLKALERKGDKREKYLAK